MQGIVWVIFLFGWMDGWMDGFIFSALKDSKNHSSPRYCPLKLVYVCIIYVWSCLFADGYLQQLFRLLQGQTTIIC